MGLLDRLRPNRRARELVSQAETLLAVAERRQIAGAPLATLASQVEAALALLREAESARYGDRAHFQLRLAQGLALQGRVDQALEPAYAAARARPYDVDSRVTHGRIRLARDELEAAGHEFASVLEEFGGDADANAGLRATKLAAGELPLAPEDELEAGADRLAGAHFLIAAWELADRVPQRLAGLAGRDPDPGLLSLLQRVIDLRARGEVDADGAARSD